jgi:hypothetical protein
MSVSSEQLSLTTQETTSAPGYTELLAASAVPAAIIYTPTMPASRFSSAGLREILPAAETDVASAVVPPEVVAVDGLRRIA